MEYVTLILHEEGERDTPIAVGDSSDRNLEVGEEQLVADPNNLDVCLLGIIGRNAVCIAEYFC